MAAGILLLPSYRGFDTAIAVRDLLVRVAYLANTRASGGDEVRTVVILVDDETKRREKIGTGEKFDARAYIAKIMARLAEVPDPHQPLCIGINVLLDSPADDPNADDAVEAALTASANAGLDVVLATRLVAWQGDRKPILPLARFLVSERVSTGHTNLLRSQKDGVVRKAEIAVAPYGPDNLRWFHEADRGDETREYILDERPDDNRRLVYPSFAGALAHTSTSIVDHRRLKSRLLEPFWIEFFSPPHEQFEIYSAYRLFHRDIVDQLAGKVVLVGLGFSDSASREKTAISVATPVLGGISAMNSVVDEHLFSTVVHAYTLDTLERVMRGQDRDVAGTTAVVTLSAAVGVALGVFWRWTRRRWLFGALIVLIPIGYAVLAVGLFVGGLVELPITRPVAAWMVTVTPFICWFPETRQEGAKS